jgi:hypothetical protein
MNGRIVRERGVHAGLDREAQILEAWAIAPRDRAG